ncbi:MAG: H+/Cl- antiporter ClcA [Candidatus Marinamargulisbacteria bacterium]|jgi:H+/Cl- antiporter ClcA
MPVFFEPNVQILGSCPNLFIDMSRFLIHRYKESHGKCIRLSANFMKFFSVFTDKILRMMNKKRLLALTEESFIFLSLFRWIVLASIVGIIVGVTAAFFLTVLHISTETSSHNKMLYFLLPIALGVSALMSKHLSPESEGHGTEKVIESVHKRGGKIKASVVPVKLLSTVLTIAAGGSAGKEGPCAQIGAGLSSIFADLFKLNDSDRKKLVICGISAGFAAVFGTPIAGAIFGVEVLFVGSILYEVLLPSFIAGMISFQVASSLGITYAAINIPALSAFSPVFFIKVILAGLFFALCAIFFIEIMRFGDKVSKKIKLNVFLKGVLGGVVLLALAGIFSTDFLGLGLDSIHKTLNGQTVVWYAFLIKGLMTSITLACGGSGGIVTPIFFIGTTAGAFFATFMNLDVATFSALGLVALLAGAANTPLAATIMAIELFGSDIAPYATLACVISFLMTGYRSAYPSQVLAINKSPSILVKTGCDIDQHEAHFEYKARRIMATGLRFGKKIKHFTFTKSNKMR